MRPSLDPRLVRLAGAAALLLATARGVPAWARWNEEASLTAAERVAEARDAEAAARALPALRDSAEARRARLAALAPMLLNGESPAAAAASLAALVSGATARTGVQAGSVEPLRPDSADAGTFVRVRVRGDASGPLPALLAFLAALEGAPELLSVREWSILQPNAGGPAELPENLRVEFVLEGLALPRPVPR